MLTVPETQYQEVIMLWLETETEWQVRIIGSSSQVIKSAQEEEPYTIVSLP